MSFHCHDTSDWFDVNVPEYCILKDRGTIKHNWFNLLFMLFNSCCHFISNENGYFLLT